MVSRINWRAVLSAIFVVLFAFGCAKAPSALQNSTTKTFFFPLKILDSMI